MSNPKELQEKYREVFGTATAAAVLNDILDYCGVERSTFAPDPYQHAHSSGKQAVGFYIINQIKESKHVRRNPHDPRTDSDPAHSAANSDPTSEQRSKHTTTAGRYIP